MFVFDDDGEGNGPTVLEVVMGLACTVAQRDCGLRITRQAPDSFLAEVGMWQGKGATPDAALIACRDSIEAGIRAVTRAAA